jgi:NADP-dependent aldehyde dehydrogenase
VFALLGGPHNALGAALVEDARIKAVGFTGSRAGGLALMRIAAARPEPIPVYAEMSSINPVFLLPGALRDRAETLAAGFVGSLTQGAGQFCTNPGLVLGLEGDGLDRFAAAAAGALGQAPAGVMLTAGIQSAYAAGVAAAAGRADVAVLARGAAGEPGREPGALFSVAAETFLGDAVLAHEIFGAASLIVRCPDADTLVAVAETLEGQLTATLHLADDDLPAARRLLPVLERKAGRILANGWPTGVEVSPAMVHGGPFPATSDGRSTSVGTLAIQRFLRPVCYQDLPEGLAPAAVQAANPLGLARLVDGAVTLPGPTGTPR